MKLNERFNIKDIEYLGLKNKYIAYYIGAGTGGCLVGLQSLGYVNIVCIEPNYKSFQYLDMLNKDKANTICLNAATSDIKSIETLYTLNTVPLSSALDKKWFTDTRNSKFYKEEDISEEVTTTYIVDGLTEMFGVPGYICIDVNGHELRTLCGINFKSELLSFPWYGETLINTISCILRSHHLGFNEFCITRYKELPIKDDVWLDHERCMDLLHTIASKLEVNTVGGTIFCR